MMRPVITFMLVVLLLAPAAFCADSVDVTLPPGARTLERIEGLPGLKNVGKIEDGLYRGAQPDNPEGYETLRKMGIKTVLNLRAYHGEREAVESHGMTSIEIPMNMLKTPKTEDVEAALRAMSDPALRPLYVHCALGEDRTGVVVAAYRLRNDGWTYKEAEDEMQHFGFNDIWIQLKHFLRRFAGEEDD